MQEQTWPELVEKDFSLDNDQRFFKAADNKGNAFPASAASPGNQL